MSTAKEVDMEEPLVIVDIAKVTAYWRETCG
jgi:hypothetical protein